MNFLADECCGANLVEQLRETGHNVIYVTEYNPGARDEEVLNKAFVENRVLITEDKDFGELVFRLKKRVKGIVLLRFSSSEHDLKWKRLNELLHLEQVNLFGHFTVVDVDKYRIRPLHY